MLNLTRRPHEAIVVVCPDGTRLQFTVLSVDGSHVMIGVEAPRTYTIDRYEVDHRKQRKAAGMPLEGQEPRGPDWIDYRKRQSTAPGSDCPHCDGFYDDETGALLHTNGCIAL